MKNNALVKLMACLLVSGLAISCQSTTETNNASTGQTTSAQPITGQSGVKDDVSQKDVVKVAVGSPDHTTLVKALQQAQYVDVLSNAGPFTVFAPTNAAFDALPAGTVDGLMKEESKADLRNILEYHVYVGVIKTDLMQDGMKLNQANGNDITITVKDGNYYVNGDAKIIASIPASNGIIHVIDKVLLPPAKK